MAQDWFRIPFDEDGDPSHVADEPEVYACAGNAISPNEWVGVVDGTSRGLDALEAHGDVDRIGTGRAGAALRNNPHTTTDNVERSFRVERPESA